MGQDEDSQAASLPGDLLEDILRRLAPRSLAVSRSVCKAWQATIDARRFLRADQLPLRLEGIFMSFTFHKFSEFFSRTGAPIAGMMDFLPTANKHMGDDFSPRLLGATTLKMKPTYFDLLPLLNHTKDTNTT
jgi:hypothetical protein